MRRLAILVHSRVGFAVLLGLVGAACDEATAGGDPREDLDVESYYEDVTPCEPDRSAPVPERPSVGTWTPVELPGTQCSDGSPYKFFVNYAADSNDLAVMLEPGGACWDYASCTGRARRGAANPEGIPDDHMETWSVAYPVWADLDLGEGENGTSLTFARQWNRVFLPYCTGDVYSGNVTRTYTSDDGEDSVEFRHVGRKNLERVVEWLNEQFREVPRMLVGGCSAGGAGALINYHLLRGGIQGVQCGYLVSDSGPIFPAGGPSDELQGVTAEAWNTAPTLESFDPLLEEVYGTGARGLLKEDPSAISDVLALAYPRDRLAVTVYRWDFNYSLYSYDSFREDALDDDIYALWGEELDALMAQYDRYPNLAYYIAHARPDNCSHCLSIAPLDHVPEALAGEPYLGTEIEQAGVNLHDFYVEVLDDGSPLRSYFEDDPPEGEGLTSDDTVACR